MAYREPTAGLLARIEELEHQLQEVVGAPEAAAGGVLSGLAGAPLRVTVERTISFELESGTHDLVVEALQKRFDTQGQLLVVGRSCHWALMTTTNQRDVNASMIVRDGATLVRVTERYKDLLGLACALTGALAFPVAMLLLRAGWVGLLAGWALLALVALSGIRFWFSRIVRRRERELRATAHDLVEIACANRTSP